MLFRSSGKESGDLPDLRMEDPLQKKLATHSRILAWETPWAEELGGL